MCVVCVCFSHSQRSNGSYVVDLIAASRRLSVSAAALLEALQRLRTDGFIRFTSGERALYVHVPVVPGGDALDALISGCHDAITRVQRAKVFRIRSLWTTLSAAASSPKALHAALNTYFAREADDVSGGGAPPIRDANLIRSDIRAFLSTNGEQFSSARQVARVLHGLSSPAFPARDWERHPFWRRHHEIDFDELLALAQLELRAMLMPTAS